MTRFITLALATSLFALAPIGASTAEACGGYAELDPNVQEIRRAVLAHFERARPGTGGVQVSPYGVRITDTTRATALVWFEVRGQTYQQNVEMRLGRATWRVVGGDRPVAV